MREYELMFIVNQTDVNQKTHEGVVEEVRKLIEQMQGRVLRVRPWGLREFAYEIEDNTHGYYVIMRFLLEPDQILELESKLKLQELILRCLILNLNERENTEEVEVFQDMVDEEEIDQIVKGSSSQDAKEPEAVQDDPKSSEESLDSVEEEIVKEAKDEDQDQDDVDDEESAD